MKSIEFIRIQINVKEFIRIQKNSKELEELSSRLPTLVIQIMGKKTFLSKWEDFPKFRCNIAKAPGSRQISN